MIWLSIVLTGGFFLLGLFLVDLMVRKRKDVTLFNQIKEFLRFKGKFQRFKTKIIIILVLGASLFIIHNVSTRIAFYRESHSYTEWRESNGEPYLYVEADNHYDLGYLTGRELADKILYLKTLLISYSTLSGVIYSDGINAAQEYLEFIPEKYQDELRGLSDGASYGSGTIITFEDILFQSLFFEVLYGYFAEPSHTAGCTAFAAVNSDNDTIIGQNVDLMTPVAETSSFVHHRLGNDPEVFSFRIGACPALPIGKTEQGVSIILNLVQIDEPASPMTPLFVTLREAFEQEDNAEDMMDALFPKHDSPYGLNLFIADDDEILGVQARPDKQWIYDVEDAEVHSNRYKDSWEGYLANPSYSEERQDYAEEKLEEEYDDDELKNSELLDILADDPIICRDEGVLEMITAAFITTKSFGMGNSKGNHGDIPV